MHEYQLRYLPQFDQDLKDCVLYIVGLSQENRQGR